MKIIRTHIRAFVDGWDIILNRYEFIGGQIEWWNSNSKIYESDKIEQEYQKYLKEHTES